MTIEVRPEHRPDTTVPRPTLLQADELREWLTRPDRPRIIDVRTPPEFRGVHIPTAYNVPLNLLQEHRDELRDPLDEQIVLICRSGMRAGQAEQLLGAAGLDRVHVLDGGVQSWEAAGLPVNRGQGAWDLERQVRLLAGGVVASAVLVSQRYSGAKWFAGAIGAGLVTAALTNTCALGKALSLAPWNRAVTKDLQEVLQELGSQPSARIMRTGNGG
ncbi:MAG: rhodanese-like domain-containing protein [Dermatophilaceae bacterium]